MVVRYCQKFLTREQLE
uniref:Uncharacterized protein n=1 Tax=Rhizophora mucronata TaxID=61149 RepID=A0A2P2N1M9_RHIMU